MASSTSTGWSPELDAWVLGTYRVWIAQWKYDQNTKVASRKPATGCFTRPWKGDYGGDCFLTKLSDQVDA